MVGWRPWAPKVISFLLLRCVRTKTFSIGMLFSQMSLLLVLLLYGFSFFKRMKKGGAPVIFCVEHTWNLIIRHTCECGCWEKMQKSNLIIFLLIIPLCFKPNWQTFIAQYFWEHDGHHFGCNLTLENCLHNFCQSHMLGSPNSETQKRIIFQTQIWLLSKNY